MLTICIPGLNHQLETQRMCYGGNSGCYPPWFSSARMDRKFKPVALSGRRASPRDRQALHQLEGVEQDLAIATAVGLLQDCRSNLCTDSSELRRRRPFCILKSRRLLLPRSLLPVSGGFRWLCALRPSPGAMGYSLCRNLFMHPHRQDG
jgi:hypothetical protein